MDWRSTGAPEEERRAPARARSAQGGGGAAGPSTVKGEIEMFYQKFKKLTVFLCCHTLGRAMRRKARRLALAEASILFSVSYCVGKTLKYMNVCLECPVFNASRAAMCHPQCLAGRWARRCAEKRVAWPWRRRQFFFLCCIVLVKC